MTGVTFDTIYPLIASKCKNVPYPLMDNAILEASREFCKRSRYRQVSLRVTTLFGTSTYPIKPSNPDEEITRIEYVTWNGQPYPIPVRPIQQSDPTYCLNLPFPRNFFYEPPNKLVILPLPVSGLLNGLSVRVVLQPTNTATTIDDSITQQYDRGIAFGALKFIMETNDSPWSNPAMAQKYEKDFEAQIQKAKMERGSGFVNGGLATAVPRF